MQALSSGEAEFVAVVKAGSMALGVRSLLRDMGLDLKKLVLHTDSSAALGMCKRAGLGRVRHLDTRVLWLQTFVRDGTFILRKIKGTENSADLGTKEVPGTLMWRYLKELGFQLRTAPHASALKAAVSALTVKSRIALEAMEFEAVD